MVAGIGFEDFVFLIGALNRLCHFIVALPGTFCSTAQSKNNYGIGVFQTSVCVQVQVIERKRPQDIFS